VKIQLKPLFFLLLAYVFLKLLFWFFAYPNIDEAYYWLWGTKPALSYYEHPPFLAWVSAFFYFLFGRSLVILRLPQFLSLLIIIFILSKILKKLQPTTNQVSIILIILSTPLIFILT